MDTGEPNAAEGALRVDFYVLETAGNTARLKLACRVAEKAYLAGQSVLIWHTDAGELAELDTLLWTFSDRSFVPHELLPRGDAPYEAPVRLLAGGAPTAPVDIVINLADSMPPFLPLTRRVAEILDGEENRRQAGRTRFRAYRDQLGVTPAHHAIKGD
jgi:DNA polymerase III subunit chi